MFPRRIFDRHSRAGSRGAARRGGARQFERLEDRQLLASGFAPFAHFSGDVNNPGGSVSIPVQVGSPHFVMPGGRVIVGFAMRQTGGSSPGQMTLLPERGAHARVLFEKETAAGGTTSRM